MTKRIIKNIIMILSIIVLCIVMFFCGRISVRKDFENRDKMMQKMMEDGKLPEMPRDGKMPFEEEIERTTKAEDVEAGENVNTEIINLSEHTTNITITEAGNYTLTGEFGNTVLIDADGEVTLNLDNAKVENKLTAALANISTNPLTINLLEGTTNVFSDGGSSEYDACVYSAGPLTFKGTGILEVYGNQEEGEGIATETNDLTIDGGNIKIVSNDDGLNAGGDGGTIKINDGTVYIKASGDGIDSNKNIVINGGKVYTIGSSKGGDAGVDADEGTTINGGELIALGSDMLEKPLSNSKQKVIAQNLSSKIDSGSQLVLKDSKGEEVVSFIADDSFKTIIISSSKLQEGKYNLYKAEELVAELECK
ncbi:MAG: carbohydrate-binding domain-containing protein [Clostridia bacterium]|nr:carbohydrate-binding domain-containing protein [Clostridia bacterium]